MPMSPTVVLLVIALFSGAATAQSRPAATGFGVRRIEFSAENFEAMTTPEVQVSPGVSTTFEFNSALLQEKVAVEGAERFALVDIGRSTLRLVPSDQVLPGERLRVTVRFLDGAAPVGTAFILVAHPAQAERLVEVWRNQRTVESYQQESKEARAEAQRCHEENERLRAEYEGPGGLAGLLENRVIGKSGVSVKPLDFEKEVRQRPGDAIRILRAWSYRSANRVAVLMDLDYPEAAQHWMAQGASLVGKTGETLNMLPVWQEAPVANARIRRLVVEAEATPDEARGTFALKLWERDGLRMITLPGVTFP
ncbi:DUF2381 family protein [Corallococcus sp. AB011P]|uniref:DUF2381 family protein n=1 Tax=Corallococcus sp. AB011P TaxID=2316735 RepID=UPI000EA11457|nr:DUF2381 family protein [Corallococcus sp. AB011P]RKG48132.1 DUF2381 family protein [Corallococcus sp. AB011P]